MLNKMQMFSSPPAPCAPSPQTALAHFWGEVNPSEHLVQIYKDDTVFLDSLEGFIAGGLKAGDGVIVIATPAHLAAIEHRLLSRGIDPGRADANHQYFPLDARETLAKFMVDGPLRDGKPSWPDDRRFTETITAVIEQASRRPDGTTRRVRAFGEMVALLWAEGMVSATIRLEHLWHDYCQRSGLCLFCAYPRAFFTDNPEESIRQICATHSRVVLDSPENHAGSGSAA